MSTFALEAFRGDTIKLLVSVTRTDPATGITAAVPLDGTQLTFTAKRKAKDLDAAAVFQKTETSGITLLATAGQLLVTILPADTNDFTKQTVLYCDCQMVEASGTITTVSYGTLTILADVTREAS